MLKSASAGKTQAIHAASAAGRTPASQVEYCTLAEYLAIRSSIKTFKMLNY